MPKAEGVILEKLCLLTLPPDLGAEWQKFSYHHPNALQNRLKLCANMAAAVFQIHENNRYTIVDLKPQNILVRSDGYIAIIDVDSFQVQESNRILFHAQVMTPDYTPPEAYQRDIRPKEHHIHETWDRFSMAVVFYRTLCGIHPFTCTPKGPYAHCTTTEDKIKHGFFPHARSKRPLIDITPPPHTTFSKLDRAVQHLFLRCFEEGHTNPALRPSAEEWCEILAPQRIRRRPLPSTQLVAPRIGATVPLQLPAKPVRHLPQKASILPAGPSQRFHGYRSSAVWHGRCLVLVTIVMTATMYALALQTPLAYAVSSVSGVITALALWVVYSKSQEHTEKKTMLPLYKAAEREVKILDGTIHDYEQYLSQCDKEWETIHASFAREQQRLLVEERQNIAAQQTTFVTLMQKKDTEATTLQSREAEAVHQAQDELHKLLEALRREHATSVQQLRFPSLQAAGALITPLRQRLAALQQQQDHEKQGLTARHTVTTRALQQELPQRRAQLTRLQNDYQSELQHLDNTLHQEELSLRKSVLDRELATYRIREHASRIFTDRYANTHQLVADLAGCGLQTAADITDADGSGRLCRADRRWVKVPQIGKQRAADLLRWRRSLEQTVESQLITAAVQQLRQSYVTKKQNVARTYNARNKTLQAQCDDTVALIHQHEQIYQGELQRLDDRFESDKRALENNIRQEEHTYREAMEQTNRTIQEYENILRNKSQHLRHSAQAYIAQIGTQYAAEHQTILQTAEDEKQRSLREMQAITANTHSLLQKRHASWLVGLQNVKATMDRYCQELTQAISTYNTQLANLGNPLNTFHEYRYITFLDFLMAIINWHRR
jgi:hypothetical protein